MTWNWQGKPISTVRDVFDVTRERLYDLFHLGHPVFGGSV